MAHKDLATSCKSKLDSCADALIEEQQQEPLTLVGLGVGGFALGILLTLLIQEAAN